MKSWATVGHSPPSSTKREPGRPWSNVSIRQFARVALGPAHTVPDDVGARSRSPCSRAIILTRPEVHRSGGGAGFCPPGPDLQRRREESPLCMESAGFGEVNLKRPSSGAIGPDEGRFALPLPLALFVPSGWSASAPTGTALGWHKRSNSAKQV